MKLSTKKMKNKELMLETDLLLSAEDIEFMKKPVFQDRQDLESYLGFLEETGAFESKKIKKKFYKEEFEL